ncbi:hypothetical protein U6G28_08920 [Actinomycetaceae bacterium MB13-C1-2]|nr:hypothetical protein U6G28_08920 [Actinomycetaceae bacterium MB13-C1-2]
MMTHRDEALRILDEADREVSENWLYNTGEHKADMIAQAQVHALLEIGEQLRVANLIALYQTTGPDDQAGGEFASEAYDHLAGAEVRQTLGVDQ